MSVRIVQCLCPLRHCILAQAYEPDKQMCPPYAADVLRGVVSRLIAGNLIRAHCEICGAGPDTWTYEDRITKFRTLAEAKPHLDASAAAQRATADALTSKN